MPRAAELVAAGMSDQTIADQLGGVSRMAVQRHRANHIIAPAKALAAVAGKGGDATEQRAQVMAAAESGDPVASVALASIVDDLKRVHERLDRTAQAAEAGKQRMSVASLPAQQLRAGVRAKIGSVGGYAPAKPAETGAGTVFAIDFVFRDHPRETFGVLTGPASAPQVLDGEVSSPDDQSLR